MGERDVEPGRLLLEELGLLEDEQLWSDDSAQAHDGWHCVRTDPFPCPAPGCAFVA